MSKLLDFLGNATGLGDVTSAGIDWATGRGARRAQRQSANALEEATKKAQNYSDAGYNQAYDLQKPYLELGNTALNDLYSKLNGGYFDSAQPVNNNIAQLTKQFMMTDPGTQWRMDQARKQQEASAAARGNLLSSGEARSLQENSQNLASQEFGNQFNRAFSQAQAQANQNNSFYDQARQKLADHFNRLQGFANLAPQTAGNLANNRIGQAGANAGFAQDSGNIQAAKIKGINDTNNAMFNNYMNMGASAAAAIYGMPAAPVNFNVGSSGSSNQSNYQTGSMPRQSWTPQPLTTNGDYSQMGSQLAELLKQGYL